MDTPPEVDERIRQLHDHARSLLFDLGRHVWSGEERARVLWAAMNGVTTTVSITLSPEITIAVRCGAELVAVIPCHSDAGALN